MRADPERPFQLCVMSMWERLWRTAGRVKWRGARLREERWWQMSGDSPWARECSGKDCPRWENELLSPGGNRERMVQRLTFCIFLWWKVREVLSDSFQFIWKVEWNSVFFFLRIRGRILSLGGKKKKKKKVFETVVMEVNRWIFFSSVPHEYKWQQLALLCYFPQQG